jgi:4-hydroxythreonine-4-phosphate dehydrogenase
MLPRIGITLGDPAGIGSEITARMLACERITDVCIPIVIGDARIVQQGIDIVGSDVTFDIVRDLDGELVPGSNYVYDLDHLALSDFEHGQVSASAGRAAGEAIEAAVDLAMSGKIEAIVTNPIHKESFSLAGYGKEYPGHTEMLAALTGTLSYCMMLVTANMRVCHVTTHVSLLDALTKYITGERILEVIRLADGMCRQLGIEEPLIGVAGINPHAGEHGLFGDEEQRLISPALNRATQMGLKAEGPIPPDTVFSKARGGWYDAVVAMYHDQGHIPCKLDGFVYDQNTGRWTMRGVNVTLGLPIIRTSVDHGTAFDQAGKGTADHHSLLEATLFAIELAEGEARSLGSHA